MRILVVVCKRPDASLVHKDARNVVQVERLCAFVLSVRALVVRHRRAVLLSWSVSCPFPVVSRQRNEAAAHRGLSCTVELLNASLVDVRTSLLFFTLPGPMRLGLGLVVNNGDIFLGHLIALIIP